MALEGVGDRVRRYRRLRRLSQQQLADAAHTDKGYVSRLEAGKIAEPGVDVLIRIAEALGVPIQNIADPRYYEADRQPTWEDDLLADPRLTDESKQALVVILRGMLPKS